jgi:hypothetical protein
VQFESERLICDVDVSPYLIPLFPIFHYGGMVF